jgi:hypothetical protein
LREILLYLQHISPLLWAQLRNCFYVVPFFSIFFSFLLFFILYLQRKLAKLSSADPHPNFLKLKADRTATPRSHEKPRLTDNVIVTAHPVIVDMSISVDDVFREFLAKQTSSDDSDNLTFKPSVGIVDEREIARSIGVHGDEVFSKWEKIARKQQSDLKRLQASKRLMGNRSDEYAIANEVITRAFSIMAKRGMRLDDLSRRTGFSQVCVRLFLIHVFFCFFGLILI